jgi:hypothetical protein
VDDDNDDDDGIIIITIIIIIIIGMLIDVAILGRQKYDKERNREDSKI